jgi:hypothetical protein
MMQFLGQMMKFPFAAFVYSMEMFVKTMQGMRRVTEQGIDMMVGGIAQTLDGGLGPGSDPTGVRRDGTLKGSAETTHQATHKEERSMADVDPRQDLGGDDLKYVTYSIWFTKRDYEAPLQPETEDVVDYPTDGGSYGALKIGEFMERVEANDVDRPDRWLDPQRPYPENAPAGRRGWRLSRDDRRYLKFEYRVIRRIPKGEADYPRQQVDVLRQIRDRI